MYCGDITPGVLARQGIRPRACPKHRHSDLLIVLLPPRAGRYSERSEACQPAAGISPWNLCLAAMQAGLTVLQRTPTCSLLTAAGRVLS